MRSFETKVVLVRTIYDSNIGASSRAMANMGIDHLILIDPKTDITLKGHQAAASGQAALENRKVYSSWTEFHAAEPEGIRICFTARDGKERLVQDFQTTLAVASERTSSTSKNDTSPVPVFLIFGPKIGACQPRISNNPIWPAQFQLLAATPV
jgi:tRNA/rRNA methyltransferase